jgi:hypothetical protein
MFEAFGLMELSFKQFAAQQAAQWVAEILEADPEATAKEVLDRLTELSFEFKSAQDKLREGSVEYATCRNCHQPIEKIEDRWTHTDDDRMVGCRPASFVEGKGWNDKLDGRWRAAPQKRPH